MKSKTAFSIRQHSTPEGVTGRKAKPWRQIGVYLVISIIAMLGGPAFVCAQDVEGPLPGTELLTIEGDLASELVAGADRFLLNELAQAERTREKYWKRDFSSFEAYSKSVEANRNSLRARLGLRDPLVADPTPRIENKLERSSVIAETANFTVFEVSWPAFGDVTGTGLLLQAKAKSGNRQPPAQVIAIPDCELTPEQLVGLEEGLTPAAQYARRLAESGCEVLVPLLINRQEKLPGLSNREWLYRPAFELGRGLVGYELQKILAAAKWMHARESAFGKLGVVGWGEGGMLALYAGALDPEIDVVGIGGYFDSRQELWQQPIDRNVFGLLTEFGDAELASLILPRHIVVDASRGREGTWTGARGAPWELVSPPRPRVKTEFGKLSRWAAELGCSERVLLVESEQNGSGLSDAGLVAFFQQLTTADATLAPLGSLPQVSNPVTKPAVRMQMQIAELDRHNQRLLQESHYVRQERTMGRLDFSSTEAYEKSTVPLRQQFQEEVIGRFDQPLLPPRPRARLFQETAAWTAYEVVLDVFPEVIAYGLLLVPKGIEPGERRPVVVCQHGLEGRPQDTVGEQGSQFYSAFAAKLAERGFITFAPQNLYIFGDRFRSLQRKANPLGKTLFSIITPQHQQIVDWLQTLEFVDPTRIGFYGLSYGGKTAMRVPALVTDYCLSICSADFNEWVDKNASTRNPRTYANMGEYEIFEYDLGSTFNYAEMAALIAPRPFMVERGHGDGVADDWTVAYEYAKVRNLYAARLKRPELTEIEWFDGPHKINGQKSFEFLHRHLKWPVSGGERE
jgi:dienelactone hydrolase